MLKRAIRRRPFLATAILIDIVHSAGTAGASAVVLVEDNRRSQSFGGNCCGSTYNDIWEPSSDFADWDGNGQSSTVGALMMTGTGVGSSYSNTSYSYFNSYFDITFAVVDPTEVSLTGTAYVQSQLGSGEVWAILTGPVGTLYSFTAYPEGGYATTSMLFEGILLPGQYRLQVETDMQPISDADYNFTFAISPDVAVPEPSTALLLGLGLIGIGFRKHKRGCMTSSL